ncbi:MAG: ParB N-terminal domain-containing protein [Tepidisphaeraceae bacterium]|jgi:hypothetical protein
MLNTVDNSSAAPTTSAGAGPDANPVRELTLSELRPYPRQCDFFDACTAAEDELLLADIQRHGLHVPIDVLPADNAAGLPGLTILDGHRRVQLVRQLHRETIPCCVRNDLMDKTATEIEATFLQLNLNRRHLSSLARARIALRLFELERRRDRNTIRAGEEREARDRVGRQIGMTGRHLARLWRVLRTPPGVQRAVDAVGLDCTLASRVAGLAASEQEQIAVELAAAQTRGEANAIVRRHLAVPQNAPQTPKSQLREMTRVLKASVLGLRGKIQDIPPAAIVRQRAVIWEAIDVLQSLARRGEKRRAELSIEELSNSGLHVR